VTCCSRERAKLIGAIPSGVALVLLPKCPACIAGYVAVATGLTVSVTAAEWLRTSILIACCAAIALSAFGLFQQYRRAIRRARGGTDAATAWSAMSKLLAHCMRIVIGKGGHPPRPAASAPALTAEGEQRCRLLARAVH
jgi:hypothetical protein